MNKDMRVAVTERMLREGMLRCLEAKPLSKITVSDLCRESGINRSTYYNHYDSPALILKEIAFEHAEKLSSIYGSHCTPRKNDDIAALEACLIYIAERKTELKILFSEHAENYLAGIAMEIINKQLTQNAVLIGDQNQREDYLLRAATAGAAVSGFIQTWLLRDIEKTPSDLVKILKSVVQGNIFLH